MRSVAVHVHCCFCTLIESFMMFQFHVLAVSCISIPDHITLVSNFLMNFFSV